MQISEKDSKKLTGILDKILDSKQTATLQNFDPSVIASQILSLLKERDRQILAKRFGLLGFSAKTLEAIGKEHNLTRERVRQIEKDSIKFLRSKLSDHELSDSIKMLANIINDCGKIIKEIELVKLLSSEATEEEKSSILFLLHLAEELLEIKENEMLHAAWASVAYNHEFFANIIATAKEILKAEGKPVTELELIEKLKQTKLFENNQLELNDKVLKNYIELSKEISKNPFGEYGLEQWREIRPKDVGDKAHVVLKHHGKPEHYSAITDLINKHGFDKRTANKESVHNELIKDPRFVLVGRGIYALTEWGYEKGVVADVIRDILKKESAPMPREEIINEVMKKRLVKRNTVLVALSNKQIFTKIGKNKYDLAKR
jgi:DNA-directed RNA polymerase delta subunit